jgi:hypothetical protein
MLEYIKINLLIAVNHKKMLLVPSEYATTFGRAGHLQALNTLYLKLKIKCVRIF